MEGDKRLELGLGDVQRSNGVQQAQKEFLYGVGMFAR